MADIADLNFKKLAEKPLEFVLTHPIDGSELEHDGKPFTFQVYAMDSKVYRDADIAEVRKQSKDDLNADIADRVINIQLPQSCLWFVYLAYQKTDTNY